MLQILSLAAVFALPFVLTRLLLAIRRMDDKEDQSSGPLPWCFLMGAMLVLIWLSLQ